MSPVLLDHRNLKWIWLSVVLLSFLTFFGGYILGFEKSNNKWMAKLDPMEITLPNAIISELIAVEQQTPEFEEPGASIDVDSVDEADNNVVSVANNPDAYTGVVEPVAIKVAVIKSVKPVIESVRKRPSEEIRTVKVVAEESSAKAISEINETTVQAVGPVNVAVIGETDQAPLSIVSEASGLLQNASEIEPLPEQAIEALAIIDDASEETARYSIQVGMYSDFNNAANKVEELLNLNLSAYLNQYQNRKDETRYNVRFGYFSSFSRGQQALDIYGKIFSDSGYVARIEH